MGFNSGFKGLNILGIIRIIKSSKTHYFSTLFWYTTLHVSDRLTVHHQESWYCIYRNWYLSYYLCWLSGSEVEMENVEFCIKIKLRNSASCWLLLYEYITMHDLQNVKFPISKFADTLCLLFAPSHALISGLMTFKWEFNIPEALQVLIQWNIIPLYFIFLRISMLNQDSHKNVLCTKYKEFRTFCVSWR